jgi:hypothetical protein
MCQFENSAILNFSSQDSIYRYQAMKFCLEWIVLLHGLFRDKMFILKSGFILVSDLPGIYLRQLQKKREPIKLPFFCKE